MIQRNYPELVREIKITNQKSQKMDNNRDKSPLGSDDGAKSLLQRYKTVKEETLS